MELSETDKQLFESLARGGTGHQLVGYLKRLQVDLCDARRWGELDTKESVQLAAKYIQEGLIDRIEVNKNPPKKTQPNQFS